MEQNKNTCCVNKKDYSRKSFLAGILYGLIPHSFCIAFILFSVVGATVATAFLKNFMLIPHFLEFLLLISLLLATISSAIYLKKNECLCLAGAKSKWKYLTTLFSTTLLVNLLMFFVILPALVNASAKPQPQINSKPSLANLSLSVQIPCSGHAPLIIDELKKDSAISSVAFKNPNDFEIQYDPAKTSPEKIASLNIFKEFPATIIN